MNEASPEKLLKKFDSPQRIKFLTDSLSHSMIKASKKVYNLSTRNIRQFIREHREMQLKRKQDVVNLKRNMNDKKKYDENQLLELEYKLVRTQNDPVFVEKCKTESSEIFCSVDRRNKKRINNKITSGFNAVQVAENNKTAMNRPKRVTYIDPNTLLQQRQQSSEVFPRIFGIRKKSKSTFENLQSKTFLKEFDLGSKLRVSNLYKTPQSIDKSPSSIMQNPSKILSKKNISIVYNQQPQKFIKMNEEKIMRYIKNLHTVINGVYEFGQPLNEDAVNRLLFQRYLVPKIQTDHQADLSTIQIESKRFSLPYTEFISEPEIRKSIHRILNISVKMAQKVVFQLLDLNKNGYIDEKDMIDLAELSLKIPEIKQDFIKMVRYVRKQETFSISNAQSNSYREDSYRQLQKLKDIPNRYMWIEATKPSLKDLKSTSLKKPVQKHERSNTYSTSEMTDHQNSREGTNNEYSMQSCHFDKKKFYHFIESKKNFFNSKKVKVRENFKFSISFQEFKNIFGNERPLAFYDIIRYLFGVRKQDLTNGEMGEQSERLRKQNESKVKMKAASSYEQKNYNVPDIIKDFQRRFTCDIEMSRYEQVLNFGKFSQRQEWQAEKQKQKQKQ